MFPLNKGITTQQAHVAIPEGLYEEEHGRDGFFGPVSHLYRSHPPMAWTRIEGPLRPQAFDTRKIQYPQHPGLIENRFALLYNQDVRLSVASLEHPMPYAFRNADGDDVFFIHAGSGALETDFGFLQYERGDYLVIPKGTTYRFSPSAKTDLLWIESKTRIRQPDRGLLGQHALYDPGVIKTPVLPAEKTQPMVSEYEVRIQRAGEFTKVFYPFDPIDVVGWKGDLTVWQLNIRDIRPVMSHRYHLAPSVHSTFVGNEFIICTFVPRPLEEDPQAMRVPFFHRNIDYDEVLFYHDGNFFSRDGIDAGMMTLHPAGIHHGPHPQALKNSMQKTSTDEIAVMLDTRNPLKVTETARRTEWADYAMSWQGYLQELSGRSHTND